MGRSLSRECRYTEAGIKGMPDDEFYREFGIRRELFDVLADTVAEVLPDHEDGGRPFAYGPFMMAAIASSRSCPYTVKES